MDNGDLRIRDLASASLLDRSRLLAGRAGPRPVVARVVVRDIGPGTRLQVRAGDLVVARRAGIPGGGEGRHLSRGWRRRARPAWCSSTATT